MKPRNQIIALKSKTIPFTLDGIKSVPHSTGIYKFYDNKKLLYVGVAGSKGSVGDIHHRLLSYQEKDNYTKDAHKSKIGLRNYLKQNKGITVKYGVTSIKMARTIEHFTKDKALFNQDNKRNS